MARIAIFTYAELVDRRALLESQTLIAQGHEVALYALATQDMSQDPAYVIRMGAGSQNLLTESEITTATMPLSKRLYRYFERKFPKLFPRLKPIGKPIFWLMYGLVYPSETPWVFRVRDVLNATMPRWFDAIKPFMRRVYWRIYRHNPASLYLALYRKTLQHLPRYDMIIAHDLPMLPVAVKAAAQHQSIIVYDSHELFAEQDYNAAERAMWMRLESAHIHKAKAVITVNPSIARELKARYHLSHVDVIYNAEWIEDTLPSNKRLFHQHFSLPPHARIVLFQGGLSFGRNLDSLVTALQYMDDETIHMVILGDGVMRQSLEANVLRLGLSHRVHFHPAVTQKLLLDYTASADLGIIPYSDTCLNNRYSTPNKLFEFIAAGLPMVATDLPEISRLIATYAMGIVGDTSTPQQLAALITRAMEPATLANLVTQVRLARSKVNWQSEGQKFAAIIARVLQS